MNFLRNLLVDGVFWGKLGIENFLLLLTGVLYLILFFLKRREGHWHRLYLYLANGCFFCCYALLYDFFRFNWFRRFYFNSFTTVLFWRILLISVFLTPIYVLLIKDIAAIIKTRIEHDT